MLNRQEADRELELAEKMNPGAWIDHSRATGQNAELIAKAAGMDAEKAYCMGL